MVRIEEDRSEEAMSSKHTVCPKCGFELAKAKKRSTPQMRRQFAVFEAAWLHWPEKQLFRPRNMLHLRCWLEVAAGHFAVIKQVRVKSVTVEQLTALLTAVLVACDRDRDRIFIEADADLVVVRKAVSIAYETLQHAEACRVFDEISNVLSVEIGMGAELLLRETAKAA